ncbi:hypothetical protein BGX21_005892, partial [Mortierella sp. AD011]
MVYGIEPFSSRTQFMHRFLTTGRDVKALEHLTKIHRAAIQEARFGSFLEYRASAVGHIWWAKDSHIFAKSSNVVSDSGFKANAEKEGSAELSLERQSGHQQKTGGL